MVRNIVLFISLQASVFGMTWSEVLASHGDLLSNNSIVAKQYEAVSSSQAPSIVDERILEIPICENQEELIDLRSWNMARIAMLPQPNRPFEGPAFNAGLPNASKMRASIFFRLQKMVDHLDKLAIEFGYASGQFDILVFEGLRDIDMQKVLFAGKLQEILLLHPDMSFEMAEKETSKWVSPVKNNTPVHSTGAAVDIQLWDNKNNSFLDLGPFGVIWSDALLAPTFVEEITDVQKNNRLYCLLAAEAAGLTNYVYEWWHFSCGDRYDVYWNGLQGQERKARYGSL